MDALHSHDLPITEYLSQWHAGSPEALARVIQLTYDEIHQLAVAHFRRAKPGDTLCPTALLNEAFLQLQGQQQMVFPNRKAFFWFFSRLIRNTIVDQIRVKTAVKRSANQIPVEQKMQFRVFGFKEELPPQTLIDLDRALKALGQHDERPCRVVECYFFAGLSTEEIADLEKVSIATVKRDLRFAKKWLSNFMSAT